FAFNASLSSVNVARAYARQQGHNLSVGSTKTLLHNAAMVDRFIAMSAKRANLRLNNTDFKELLFYGVRAVA
ncbi:MAG: transposase, partial [Bacteroidales bacterium]|nr:transposase [Bacteroidales bacterium]